MNNVLIRIARWMSAGLLISFGWEFYFAAAAKDVPIGPIVMTLARLTNPIAAMVLFLNPASQLGFTWVAVTNAAMYALFGLIVETVRRLHRSPHLSS